MPITPPPVRSRGSDLRSGDTLHTWRGERMFTAAVVKRDGQFMRVTPAAADQADGWTEQLVALTSLVYIMRGRQ